MITGSATQLDERAVTTIRTLAMDAVQQANSGHPGTPMALAPLAYRLYTRHMRHDPTAPDWPDRDRFVLSCGHASMLLYATLHLSGYDVTLDQLRNFRQLHSPTAGHPEVGELPGIETTTGPLGQGMSNAVGMALAERMLAARVNGDETLVDHWTWALASDGDLMEGVQAEAASLAGHLKLGRLVVFWDDNRITIDGTTDLSFSEDVGMRYASYGWQVLRIDDVNDLAAIDETVERARDDERPTLVIVRSHIGFGSPLQDSPKAHGAPLGPDNIRATKEAYDWPADEAFLVPDDVAQHVREQVIQRGGDARAQWQAAHDRFAAADPAAARELSHMLNGTLPHAWHQPLDDLYTEGGESLATRQASHAAINAVAKTVPWLVGGSADLAESNLTTIEGGGDVRGGDYAGRTIHFGIREHAMAAIANGMSLHGGFRPYVGTFLTFSDYMKPSIRLAALMRQPVTYVFTHDSVWLGEDGPTHQPIEHAAALRAIPNVLTVRPCDARETAQAWELALRQTERPTALLLTRQKLTNLKRTAHAAADIDDRRTVAEDGELTMLPAHVELGAYVIAECAGDPDIVLIGTGSEVHTCLAAAHALRESDNACVRVVSMPSWEVFAEQPVDYRNDVLLPYVPRVAVEAGTTFGWERWVGDDGAIVGIDRFGLSAPGDQAADALGINVDNVVRVAREVLARTQRRGMHE